MAKTSKNKCFSAADDRRMLIQIETIVYCSDYPSRQNKNAIGYGANDLHKEKRSASS